MSSQEPQRSAPNGIMVVDDEPSNLAVLVTILERAGFRTRTAVDGETALKSALASPPELILLDVLMPGMSGYEVCRELKRHEETYAIPCILITALAEKSDKLKGFQAGAIDYIVKPFDQEEVLVRVTTHISLARARIRLQITDELASANTRLEAEIKERCRVEQTIKDALEFNQLILDQSPAGVILFKASGPCISANPKAAEIIGGTQEKLLKINFLHLESWKNCGMLKAAEESLATKQTVKTEVHTITTFGKEFWVEAYFTPFRRDQEELVLLLILDIRDRKQAEEQLQMTMTELRLSEEKYRQLIQNSHDAIFVEQHGLIRFVNPMCSKLTGLSQKEILGKNVTDLAFPEDREKVLEHYQQVARQNAVKTRWEIRLRNTHDREIWFWLNAIPITWEGAPATLNVATDITEHRKAEEVRQDLIRQKLQMQKLESLANLAGGMAHDFNNILAAIRSHAELGLNDTEASRNSPEKTPGELHLTEIIQSTQRAADLCQKMLSFSGRGQFVIEPIEPGKIVKDVAALIQNTLPSRCDLKLEMAENLPFIEGDASQLRQVLVNLATNALESLNGRCGTITITLDAVSCSETQLQQTYSRFMGTLPGDGFPAGTYLRVQVADNGCGMDTNTLERICDPFFTTKFAGRGLGFPVVQGIVRGHKGLIDIVSQIGKGTTIFLYFPIIETPEKPLAAPPLQVLPNRKMTGRVLLVDDDAGLRSVTSQILEVFGFSTVTATNGCEAVEIYKKDPHFDVVLLDMTMPKMNGEETLIELRQLNPRVRVVLMSGYSEQDLAPRFAGKGLASFLQKPFSLNLLKTHLLNALNQESP